MTVPMNPQTPRSEARAVDEARPPRRVKLIRGRRLVTAGVVTVGLGVVALVLTFPRLATPIGTSAGVVAVVVPLVQRAGRNGSSDGGTEDEP